MRYLRKDEIKVHDLATQKPDVTSWAGKVYCKSSPAGAGISKQDAFEFRGYGPERAQRAPPPTCIVLAVIVATSEGPIGVTCLNA
jgi:hypothetical protein